MKQPPLTILLIDDDEDDYILTGELLAEIEGSAFVLDWTSQIEIGLQDMRQHQHDVYLIDYRLGQDNGLEIMRQAIANGCNAPLILLTNQGNRAVDLEAMQSGAMDYLVKGQVTAFELERSIRYALERKQTEAVLTNRSQALAELAIENARLFKELQKERDRLLTIEEEVRRRLARDLHDGPAQLLAVNINTIQFIQKLLIHQPDMVAAELTQLLATSDKALHQLRTLLFDLRPVILETQGLVPALYSYRQKQQDVRGPTFYLDAGDFSRRLPPLVEQAIFSIIQEAVGNVKKHAQARDMWLTLHEQHNRLYVTIKDNGHGFDPKQLAAEYDQRGSLGMLNMKERAEAIGGGLSVQSRLGSGTLITLTVPLPPEV